MIFSWCASDTADIDLHARVAAAFEAWGNGTSCQWSAEDRGECDTAGAVDLKFISGDPDDAIEDGIPVVVSYELDGAEVSATRVDLNDIAWSSDAEVEAGTCSDALNLDALLRHEIGHLLGLSHTCEEADPCGDEEREALMYWATAFCDDGEVTPLDLDLLNQATSPIVVTPVSNVTGPPPLEVCVSVTDTDADASTSATVTWDFGDGETAEGLEACHTWDVVGSYDVAAHITYGECDPTAVPYTTVIVTNAEDTTGDGTQDTGVDRVPPDDCGCSSSSGGGWLGALVGLLAVLGGRRKSSRETAASAR